MITSCPTSHLDFIFPVPNIGDDCMNLSRIPFLTHPANLLKYQFSFHPSTNPLSAIYNLLLFLVNHFRLLLFTGISKNSRKWKSINYQHLSCLYRMKNRWHSENWKYKRQSWTHKLLSSSILMAQQWKFLKVQANRQFRQCCLHCKTYVRRHHSLREHLYRMWLYRYA